jgi:hypothetical protein
VHIEHLDANSRATRHSVPNTDMSLVYQQKHTCLDHEDAKATSEHPDSERIQPMEGLSSSFQPCYPLFTKELVGHWTHERIEHMETGVSKIMVGAEGRTTSTGAAF